MSELSDAVAALQNFKLDTLQATEGIVNPQGQPTLKYQAAYQKLVRAVQQAIVTLALSDTSQDNIIADVQAALNAALAAQADLSVTQAFIRTRDSAVSSLTIDADTSSVTISNHDRQYLDPSETVSVTGDTITGLSSSTTYYIHYTDSDYSGGAVGYQASTALEDAVPSPTEPFRHYVGYVEVPAVGTATGTAAPDPYWKVVSALGGGGGSGDLLSTNNLSDLANASTALTNLGLSANGKSLVTAADYAAMKVLLSLVVGTDVQAYGADLTAIEALSGTNTIYYRSAANTWTAVTFGSFLSFAGGLLSRNKGTSFPGSPASGDFYYRTDRNIEYFYDGTRWLSTQLFTQDVRNSDQTLPISATSFFRAPFPFFGLYDIYVERVQVSSFPTATTATNYFVCQLSSINGGSSTNIGSTISSQNDTQNTWTAKSISAAVVVSSTTEDMFQLTVTETGTASSYILGSFVYRLVG